MTVCAFKRALLKRINRLFVNLFKLYLCFECTTGKNNAVVTYALL